MSTKFLLPTLLSLVLGTAGTQSTSAADFYLSPTGQDTNAGTQTAPVATFEKARELTQRFAGREPVTIHAADGIYYLPETLVLGPQDSGTPDARVDYVAENEGGAVISGGTELSLQWESYRDGIYRAATPPGLEIDQLFVNGKNQRMARYPNFDAAKKTAAYQGFAADAFAKQRAAGWADPTGGYIHAMHRARWGGYHYRITGKDNAGEVTYEGGWQNNRQMGMHKDYRMVENIFEELDAPGEWFHNAVENTLYYKPAREIQLQDAVVQVVRLRHLVEFRGTEDEPVKNIAFRGFVVRHAARTFMQTKEPLLRSDWAIYRGGAFVLTGTEGVQLIDMEFDQVGGNAVFVSNYNRDVLVRGCHIHDTGASGVCFVGDPNAVRDPLFQYRQKNDLANIDRTPGPQSNNYPADSTVEDCLIHGVGRVERQPAGVQIEMAQGITVRDCSIYDCARAGINIGDGAWGGHLIERCDVFDTVQETHDHGSFNSWGRDRYWRSDHLTASQKAVDQDPELPFLDAVHITVLRNSRWRCDHGWDIDLDDGSSNYDIYNNLMLAGGLKLREGFRRRAWNNITVNNGLHAHVWFNNSQDEVFGNIFMTSPRCARMPSQTAKGKRIDENLYYAKDVTMKDRYVEFGWDVNSIVADPEFVDPKSGDFRVREGSPALEIGFENFPMDQFGVKKPALKTIAKTPIIPELDVRISLSPPRADSAAAAKPLPKYMLGAKLHELRGEEFSAYGVSKQEGGVALAEVPERSDAAQAGLMVGDFIQAVNKTRVKDIGDLLQAYLAAGDSPLKIEIVRNQQKQEIVASKAAYLAAESAATTSEFSHLTPPKQSARVVKANQRTNNQPIEVLVDGMLEDDFGPVFANQVAAGAYQMDLGKSAKVLAITSWTANHNGNRGAQRVTLYGSNAKSNPGWQVEDRSRFTPLASFDTTGSAARKFNAVSLRARPGEPLGSLRWIVWQVSPVTPRGENSAFQELHVETEPAAENK